jgi:membrane protein DedA with SNARE-associated domain
VTDTLSACGWLFLVVAFGSVVPIVPTGAAVSAVAAFAFHRYPYMLGLVVAAGAAGAYVGDLVMYAMCRFGGEKMARRLRWLRDDHHLAGMKERLRASQTQVLLVSRLIPGGRVPVLLAAAFTGIGWRTFVVANVPACVLWSIVYATIGLLSGSLFAEPWQGVAAAVVLILLVNQALTWFSKKRAAGATAS